MTTQLLDDILARYRQLPEEKQQDFKETVWEATKDKVWIPNPGPQTRAYLCEADELFYGGQAGGGKTDLIIGLALTRHSRSLILRRTNKEAEKLPERVEEILGHSDGLNRSTGTWKTDGRIIDMGGCQLEADKQKRKGIPHDLKAFDEVSDFSESQFRFICAWNRSSDPNQRCRVVATGNPPTTAEGYWVVKYWAPWLDPTYPNPAEPGELRWFTTSEEGKDIEVNGPGPHLISGEQVMARSRTFIRAKLSDNPDLAATNYDSVLAALPERERQAYRDGRFDLAIQDEINQSIPTSWIRAAQDRWESKPASHIPMCAVAADMTGGGKDPMIIAKRYDGWFAPLIEKPAKLFLQETMGQQAAGFIMEERRDEATVIIDLGGGYGSSAYEHLVNNGIEVKGFKGSKKSALRSDITKMPFANDRSAAIWKFREALDPSQPGGSRIMLPDDPEMVADLTAPTYSIRNNVITVEPKEKVIERLGRSTDKGDAVMMCWFYGNKLADSALEWAELLMKRSQFSGSKMPKVVMGRQHARRQ
jgi:hypothetical protein